MTPRTQPNAAGPSPLSPYAPLAGAAPPPLAAGAARFICFLAALYPVSLPERMPWRRNRSGADQAGALDCATCPTT